MLADVFENFENLCIEIYQLEPARLLTAPELAWKETLKKATVKFNLLTEIDILLMVEKGIKGGICHAIYR